MRSLAGARARVRNPCLRAPRGVRLWGMTRCHLNLQVVHSGSPGHGDRKLLAVPRDEETRGLAELSQRLSTSPIYDRHLENLPAGAESR